MNPAERILFDFSVFLKGWSRSLEKSSPEELYKPVRYILSLGGKRVRPLLVILSGEMFNGNRKNLLPLALALEVFHNFTLVHDDIMDKALLRRNKKTVHKKWNTNAAILSGDAMLVMAVELILQSNCREQKEILSLFSRTAIQVCEGQQLDMNFEKLKKVSIPQYLEMIRLKTAVLLGACLKIGALASGAAKKDADNLYRFGENMGIAFQLKDDLLDVFGSPEKFGKIRGGDIVSNKKTFLFLKALELAGKKDREKLKALFSGRGGKEKIKRVTSLYEKLNVLEATEEKMKSYYRKGLASLGEVSIPETKKKVLRELAYRLMMRES